MKKYRETVSYGIACCRYNNNNRPELLMINKRHTYAYHMFVNGKYNNNNGDIIRLLNMMTVEEKLEILSLNFAQIWYRLWLNSKSKNSSYYYARNKFESIFVKDGGARLQKLIAESRNAYLLWEIPKGRKRNKNETNIQCAIREFQEETGLQKQDYKILPHCQYRYSFVDDGIKYTNIYFIAVTKYNKPLRVSFKLQEQLNEISNIKWMSTDAIRYVSDEIMAKHARKIFQLARKV